MIGGKLQRLLFWAAWLVAALLLGRFAFDFAGQMPHLLGVPFIVLVTVTLGIGAVNIARATLGGPEPQRPHGWADAALLVAVPAGFLAASLDCTGLSSAGCTPYCTFIKLFWIPAIAVVCGTYAARPQQWILTAMLLMSFAPLAPHCLCFNPGNGFWIEHLGASPTCYAWGFATSLLSLSALASRKNYLPTLLVTAGIVGGATAFFIGHHYFQFPW